MWSLPARKLPGLSGLLLFPDRVLSHQHPTSAQPSDPDSFLAGCKHCPQRAHCPAWPLHPVYPASFLLDRGKQPFPNLAYRREWSKEEGMRQVCWTLIPDLISQHRSQPCLPFLPEKQLERGRVWRRLSWFPNEFLIPGVFLASVLWHRSEFLTLSHCKCCQ